MKPTIRFIHAADLHLDSPYVGMQNLPEPIFKDVKESTLLAYNRLIELAIEEKVDFVLFVGDLFDQQSTSIKSVITLKRGLEKLKEHGIYAYISYGNHDFGICVKADLTFPDNTFVFQSEEIQRFPFNKNGEEVAQIYGFSYEKRAVKKKMIREFNFDRPDVYQIGTLHGSIQSNTDHDVYAPFQLEDFEKHQADYWALGHIHKREILSENPYIIYPGNIQGRHINEPGEKGCYVVEMSPHRTEVEFHALQEIIFEQRIIEDSQANNLEELTEELFRIKESWRNSSHKYIIRLHLHLPETFASTVEQQQVDELLELLNEQEDTEKDWIWIQAIYWSVDWTYDRDEMKASNQFIGEVLQAIDDDEDPIRHLDILANNRVVKKHVEPFTKESLETMKKEAEQMIVKELIKDGES